MVDGKHVGNSNHKYSGHVQLSSDGGGRDTAGAMIIDSGHPRVKLWRPGRPMLFPRPTLAAHNGRMMMEYERANKTGGHQ